MPAPDLPAIASRLAGRTASIRRILVFGTVGSTQDEAAALAREIGRASCRERV